MRKLSTASPDEDYRVTMAVEISRSQVVTLNYKTNESKFYFVYLAILGGNMMGHSR